MSTRGPCAAPHHSHENSSLLCSTSPRSVQEDGGRPPTNDVNSIRARMKVCMKACITICATIG
eukprot:1156631-Pelagomonas_calceolata.AAC.6